MSSEALPDDPETLKAMLLAERVRNERLLQIIKELQRHRFGRRAETLPEDQMLLGLEDVEQDAAGDEAKIDAANPAERANRSAKRRQNRASLPAHLPRIEMVVDIGDPACPCCSPSGSTPGNAAPWCRHSSACCWCAGPNAPAGHARTWSYRRPRLRG